MKWIVLTVLMLLPTMFLFANSGLSNVQLTSNAVPIIESIVAVLGLGVAYVVRLVHKNRKGF